MNNLFYCSNLDNNAPQLDEEELAHLRSLRVREGDIVYITDGKGLLAEGILESFSHKKCQISLFKKEKQQLKLPHSNLALAPLKNTDKLAWLVEKAVELGIQEISLVQSQYCERTYINTERLMRKAIAALKQSLSCFLPVIHEVSPFETFISQVQADCCFIPHIKKGETSAPSLYNAHFSSVSNCILIGPEGGFSEVEISLAESTGWLCVSMGQQRLRAETAAFMACAVMHQKKAG